MPKAIKNIKNKFSKKPHNEVVDNVAENNRIELPGGSQIVIGNMVDNLEEKMIVDPANAKTMDGNGGVSGAIKEYYKKSGKLKDYEADIHKVAPENGFVCPNGKVRFTSTAGIDIVHTSVPDLREKENRVKGSKTEATDEAKQKMFDAYYHAFEYAHLHQVEHAKALDCPLLGAGIFKWPAHISAEIAGRALQAFREAYGDAQQINICMRPADFNERFTQQNLVTAVKEGIEQQVAEPMKPSGMGHFTLDGFFEMGAHLKTVSIEDLTRHYNEYVASGRVKAENDDSLISTLKKGFQKLDERGATDRIDQIFSLAFALVNVLKEQSNFANQHKNATPAFVKLCDDYLDKIAVNIKPEILTKMSKNPQISQSLFNDLGITLPPLQNPSAPPDDSTDDYAPSAPPDDSTDELTLQPVRPSAPDFTKSEYDLQYSPAQPTARPASVKFSKPQASTEASPIKDLIAHLQRGLRDAPQQTSVSTHAILAPLIKNLEKLSNGTEPSAEKIRLARDMLQKVWDQAYMTDGGEHVLNVIHAISEKKPNEAQRQGTPKHK